MSLFLGIDTSNYTTSFAIFDSNSMQVFQEKRLLPVEEGKLGLRQSDAVFHHTKQLPELIESLISTVKSQRNIFTFCEDNAVEAIAFSSVPTRQSGSYMPCFLVGEGAARQLGAVLCTPVYDYSHQQGHVCASIFGADGVAGLKRLDETFLAFHVSGGTTDLLLVSPEKSVEIIQCELIAKSLDLKAGQLVDRVGAMLGLPFPAGVALEKIALGHPRNVQTLKLPKTSFKEGDCSLSGVENKCKAMIDDGCAPSEVALFCLLNIASALDQMLDYSLDRFKKKYPGISIVFSGGVTSNSIIRSYFSDKFGDRVTFSPPEFSCDNAVGTALLGYLAHNKIERYDTL